MDTNFPPSLCLTIVMFSVYRSTTGGKRDLSPNNVPLNADGEQWRCVCNSTYASPTCCTVNDGMVWEYLTLIPLSSNQATCSSSGPYL